MSPQLSSSHGEHVFLRTCDEGLKACADASADLHTASRADTVPWEKLAFLQDGLFGWAKSALMSGIRGVWSRSQKENETPKDKNPPAEGLVAF